MICYLPSSTIAIAASVFVGPAARLALVEIGALVIGDRPQELSAAFTDDVAGALRDA